MTQAIDIRFGIQLGIIKSIILPKQRKSLCSKRKNLKFKKIQKPGVISK